MVSRSITIPLRRAAIAGFPVLVQGPRGAGKSTMLRNAFPAHTWVTLEDAATRQRARSDPRAFLARLRGPTVIDDLHRVPELVVAIEGPRPLVLASSLRLKTPFQTFELYPPTRAEREGRPPLPLAMLGRFEPAPLQVSRSVPPPFPNDRTWLDRDVRGLVNVHDLDRFEEFALFAESQSGQVLDQQAMARQCGLSHRTVTRWLQIMDTCFRLVRLPASGLDFGRRLVRSPRLHFTGSDRLESRAVLEIYRNALHTGLIPELTHWLDSNGLGIPLVIELEGAPVMPVEIAAEPTPATVARLRRWMALAGVSQGALVAERGGQLPRKGILICPEGLL